MAPKWGEVWPACNVGAGQMATHSPVQGRATGLTGRRRECDVLDRLIEAVRAGESRALVLRGEPGVGKTALLDYVAGHASGCRVVRAAGVQSEMELAFAGLHQLCAPMLDHLDRLPVPQRDALRTAFGLSAGPAPDRFLVGLAVLSLLSEVAEERPLVCLVDDEQWLDRASAQALAFVARRLAAESVGLVFAAREPGAELAGLPELAVEGLREDDARALLDSVLTGPLDARVRDRIVAETRGNPLALLELPRGLTPAELAGGFGLPGAVPLSGRIEESFRRRLDALPAETRRLLLLAAADPVGDPCWCGGRPSGSGSVPRRRRRRPRPGWSSSAPGCGSVIRWCARRSTGRRRAGAAGGAPRAGRGHRSAGRSRPPRLAPGAGRARAGRGRRRGARALGRPGAGARGPGRGGRVPRARGDC